VDINPIGKVDIAAIRAQAQKATDDRPTIVKGAYEPVGKVDIAAIRAKAQKPSDDVLVSSRPLGLEYLQIAVGTISRSHWPPDLLPFHNRND